MSFGHSNSYFPMRTINCQKKNHYLDTFWLWDVGKKKVKLIIKY